MPLRRQSVMSSRHPDVYASASYIRQAGERLHLVHTPGDSLRISDVTLERVHLQTETGSDPRSHQHLLLLRSHLVAALTADLFGRLLQDVQLPEASTQAHH